MVNADDRFLPSMKTRYTVKIIDKKALEAYWSYIEPLLYPY